MSLSSLPLQICGVFFVALTAVLSFYNSLSGDFVFDDKMAILPNNDVNGKNPIWRVFVDDFWGGPMNDPLSHKSYRPLTVLTFRMNYAFSGSAPWAYHAVNVGMHLIVSLLLLFAAERVFGSSRQAFVCATLFAAHPIHTEAVANIAGRADVFAGMWFLLAVLAKGDSHATLVLELLLACAAFLSKETGIAAFGMCILLDMVQFGGPWLSLNQYKLWVQDRYLRLSAILLVTLLMLTHRAFLLGGSMVEFSWEDNPAAFDETLSVLSKAMTHHYIAALHAWLLVFPNDLCADRSGPTIPMVTSAMDLRNILTAGIYGSLLLVLHYAMRLVKESKTHAQDKRVLIVGLAILVGPFIPASNLLVNVGFVTAERVLYIPSMGFCMLLAHLLFKFGSSYRWPAVSTFVGLVCLYMWKTAGRNSDWISEESLMRSISVAAPKNIRGWHGLARILAKQERIEETVASYRRGSELDELYTSRDAQTAWKMFLAHADFGHYQYMVSHNWSEADTEFQAAFQWQDALLSSDLYRKPFSRKVAEYHYTYGTLLHRTHGEKEADREYKAALRLNPGHKAAMKASTDIAQKTTHKNIKAVRHLELGTLHAQVISLTIDTNGFSAFDPTIYHDADGNLDVLFRVSNACHCSECSSDVRMDTTLSLPYGCNTLNATDATSWELTAANCTDLSSIASQRPLIDDASCLALDGIAGGPKHARVLVLDGSEQLVCFQAAQCRKKNDGTHHMSYQLFVSTNGAPGRLLQMPEPNPNEQVENEGILFQVEGKVFMSYTLAPMHEVFSIDVNSMTAVHFGSFDASSLVDSCRVGGSEPQIGGGTAYVAVGDYLIGLAHVRYTKDKDVSLPTGDLHAWYAIRFSERDFKIQKSSTPFRLPGHISDQQMRGHDSWGLHQRALGLVKQGASLMVSYGEASCDGAVAIYSAASVLKTLGVRVSYV